VSPRTLFVLLAGGPLLVLACAYAWLAWDHRTLWLFGTVVHEGGRYTLAETVLYARHFLRELPVAVLYAAAPAAAASAYGPRATTAPSPLVRGAALLAAALVVGGAWVETSRRWGADVAWNELLQSHLRDEDAPIPGVHWGYHLLSTVAYVGASVVAAVLLRRTLGGRAAAGPDRALGAVVVAMIALCILCGTDAAPFVDARHLGHQAREAATHLVVTLPLAFAVLLAVGRWRRDPDRPPAEWPIPVVVAAVAGGVALAYVGIGALVSSAARSARPVGLSSLVAAHCFEHALDVVFVVFLVVALAPKAHSREAREIR
jgi:hypothetical protein